MTHVRNVHPEANPQATRALLHPQPLHGQRIVNVRTAHGVDGHDSNATQVCSANERVRRFVREGPEGGPEFSQGRRGKGTMRYIVLHQQCLRLHRRVSRLPE